MLRIHLFGAPAVYDENGRPLVIPRRLTRALLYYLAAQGRPVTRDHLIDRFWPDEPLEKARASLRDALAKLRDALPEKDLLQATRENVTLDFERVAVDLLEMQALLENVQAACRNLPDHAFLPAETYRQMLGLMQLWNGRSFLPGGDVEYSDALSDWTRETEERLTRSLVRLARRLAAHEAASGHPDQAIHWLKQALQFDEFDADLHQAILENYLKSDALKEARAYYESLEEIYGNPADYPPGVRAMETRIYASPHAGLPALPPDWNVRQSLQVPFIGQEELLEQMERAYRTGGGVLIYGEAGSGKTRLVQEFFRRQRGFPRLMLAACQPLEAGIPFAPWIRLLRNSIGASEWRQVGQNWVNALALLLPELNLTQRATGATARLPDASRSALLEAIHRVLLLTAKRDPLILFLDDVHWADESTLAIAAYLLREEFFSQGRGLLVMTARIEEPNPQLDRFLLTPYPQPVRRLEMRALTPEEIGELCAQVLSRPLPFAIVEQLVQDTGGNPFFLLEILSRLQEMYPADALADAERLPLPASISDLVKARLATLPSEARELLSLAAVMGSSFEVALLERAASFGPEQVIDALEALEANRLIRSLPGDQPAYAFRHEKIRESLLNELSPGRKRLLNQKCALALEAHYGRERERVAAKLALHYEAAGELVNAFACWKIAARNAYRLASFYECLDAYHRAERLLPRAIGLTDEQIYELYIHWMMLAFDNEDAAELERMSQSLSVLGRERASDLLTAAAFSALSQAHMARNQFEQAYQAAVQGFSFASRSGNTAEMARSMVRQGMSLLMLGRLNEARGWLLKTLENAPDPGNHSLRLSRTDALAQLSILENLAGFPARALGWAQQAIAEAESAGYLHGKVVAVSAQALTHYLTGAPAQGHQAALHGLSLLGQMSAWRLTAYLDIYCALNALEMGLIGPAWKHAQHAIDLGRKYGHGELTALGYLALGDLYAHLRHFARALQCYEQSAAAAGEHFIRCLSLARRGYVLAQQGEASGLAQLAQARELARDLGLNGLLHLVQENELEALAARNEQEAFEMQAQAFLAQTAAGPGAERTQHTVARLRALLFLRQGKPAKALPLLSAAASWYHDQEYRWLELQCLELQALALRASEQNTHAVQARVETILDELENSLEDAPILFAWQAFWERYRL